MRDIILNYLFRIEFKSCASEKWVYRSSHAIVTRNNQNPYLAAGEILARHMDVTERGVRVTFLGLQEQSKRGEPDKPITPMGPFTLTLERLDKPIA